MELEKKYNHESVEEGKYDIWLSKEYFKCNPESEKKPYTIVLPGISAS